MAFFNDLVDAFTGKAQRRDLEQAAERAAAIDARTRSDVTGTQREAREFFRPAFERGDEASRLIGLASGLGSPEEEAQFFERAQLTPELRELADEREQGIERSAAARGRLISGATLRAVGGVRPELRHQVFNERLSRLAQLAGLGAGAAAGAANITSDIAGAQAGFGAREADRAIQLGNVRAQSRSVPINNLIEIARGAGQVAAAAAGAGG